MSKTDKSIETGRLVLSAGGEWGVTTNGCEVSFWGDINVIKFIVVMVA